MEFSNIACGQGWLVPYYTHELKTGLRIAANTLLFFLKPNPSGMWFFLSNLVG